MHLTEQTSSDDIATFCWQTFVRAFSRERTAMHNFRTTVISVGVDTFLNAFDSLVDTLLLDRKWLFHMGTVILDAH